MYPRHNTVCGKSLVNRSHSFRPGDVHGITLESSHLLLRVNIGAGRPGDRIRIGSRYSSKRPACLIIGIWGFEESGRMRQ